MIVNDPPNSRKLDKLYAVLSVDEKGNEGIVAGMEPPMPFVTGEPETAKALLLIAKHTERYTLKTITLAEFIRVKNA